VQNEGQPAKTLWLDAGEESPPLQIAEPDVASTHWRTTAQYLRLGFTHIIPFGLDHILFVLGIFLLTTRWKAILAQVTAFTLAHSITLGLTMYGVVELSPGIVEPLIALSILYVAVENMITTELKPWRVAIVFAFGLLHGMGFAGVLRDLAPPRAELITALVAFNVGVELAQLAIIALGWAVVARWHSGKSWYRPRLAVPASAVIAATGAFWAIQRIVA
jgi:hydrogenase/urease accessory protein HupE